MSTNATSSLLMSTQSSSRIRSSDNAVITTPLVFYGSHTDANNSSHQFVGHQSIRSAARFLQRASSRLMMQEPSVLVRETAAEELEQRQSDWAYSKPVVVLDIMLNFLFVSVAASVIVSSTNERPVMPLRLWIFGYALQCVLHVVFVWFIYRRLQMRRSGFAASQASGGSDQILREGSIEDPIDVVKNLESANTLFSFIWWIVGFYWVSAGVQDESVASASPQIFWLCIIFLAFDVFFVTFCVALACVIGIAVCCCLPCIIAILYAVADQEGASYEDIDKLRKFRFQRSNNEKLAYDEQRPVGGIMTDSSSDSSIEYVLPQDDAECCVCLSAYEDGVELRELPCGHHFHCACIDKWLFINATCPLCKYNILKDCSPGREEV